MSYPLIGIMGPGEGATAEALTTARALGAGIAQQGWVLLTGGRAVGVMAAASQGAQQAGGWVVGILPGERSEEAASAVSIPIVTGMGHGRNAINVLSSQVVVVCGLGAGTVSEMALAIKLNKPLVLMHVSSAAEALCQQLAQTPPPVAHSPDAAIALIQQFLARCSPSC